MSDAAAIAGTEPDRLILIAKIARLYHQAGLRQVEIAERLGLSQSQVSRSLRIAVQRGLIRTIVVPPAGVHADLEESVRERYGLRDVIIADARGSAAEVRAALGRVAAHHLETIVLTRDRVGVSSWSSTLLAAIDESARGRIGAARSIVQLLGGIGRPTVQIDANRIMQQLADITGATAIFIPAPGLVPSASARRLLLHDRALAAAAAEWDRLTVLLLGIGAADPSDLLNASGNAVSAEEQGALVEAGAVGDVSLRFFDRTGHTVDASVRERVFGITEAQIRAVPRRIGVAGGHEKREAVAAALRGGWLTTLITDVGVAEWLASEGGPDDA